MALTCFTRFGTLLCQFQHFGSGELWNMWEWKLDPYRISVRSFALPDLIVRNTSKKDYENKISFPEQLLQEETSGFFKHQIFRASDGGTIWSFIRNRSKDVYLQYAVSSNWEQIILLTDNTGTSGQLAFEYLGQIMPSVMLNQHALTFHGVLMEYQGKGIILSAPSGTGKTTHARLWRDSKRALIVNGDRATCQKINGIWTGFGLPWSGTSGEQIHRSISLTALVVLEQGKQNEAHLIHSMDAFSAILPHIQCPPWDAELTGMAMELADDFLNHVPVIHLICRPDVEAVETLSWALKHLSHKNQDLKGNFT